jgi:hypothetical protein
VGSFYETAKSSHILRIQFSFLLTHWVASEILISDNVKNQATMIMRFLKVAKKCYEMCNFSSAFAIYDALQDITIRNLPAWQHVNSKCIHIMEKIAAHKVDRYLPLTHRKIVFSLTHQYLFYL